MIARALDAVRVRAGAFVLAGAIYCLGPYECMRICGVLIALRNGTADPTRYYWLEGYTLATDREGAELSTTGYGSHDGETIH